MKRKNSESIKHTWSVNWSKKSVGIVVADFNADITGNLLKGVVSYLMQEGFKESGITIMHVPGSFEIPLACQHLAKTKKFDGLVALGAIIKGDTDHYYYISNEASRGVMTVMLEESIPIGFGVITTSNLKQAKERSGAKNNKGEEAAKALLLMIQNGI